MQKLEAGAQRCWEALMVAANFMLIFEMLFIVANIVLRRVFNAPIVGSTEIIRYTSLIGAAFALASNEWRGGNIRVTMLLEAVPRKVAQILSLIADIIMTGGLIVVSYYLIQQTIKYAVQKDVTLELALPMWIFAAVLSFGMITFALCSLLKTILQGARLASGRGEAPEKGGDTP